MDSGRIAAYRARTFRTQPSRRVKTRAAAIKFVRERGFVHFWPIKKVLLPSLWVAVAGDRPVANEHGDAGHITWGWKDELLGERKWYYAKVLRKKATMIALEVAPYFYAMSENYGDPESDYLQLYEDGLLSQPAKLIFEALLEEGRLDTVNLRRKIHMKSNSSKAPFERGLVELQRDFKILPVGVANTGAWNYSFIYEPVHTHYPDLLEQARRIGRNAARRRLVELYFDSVGAATAGDVKRVFQWGAREVHATLDELVQAHRLRAGFRVEKSGADQFVLASLASQDE
ncbi:MAG: DNA glycosylase AlkZ-like family protein [Anaerolineales bacterium]